MSVRISLVGTSGQAGIFGWKSLREHLVKTTPPWMRTGWSAVGLSVTLSPALLSRTLSPPGTPAPHKHALDAIRQGGSGHKDQASWAKASPVPVSEKTKQTKVLLAHSQVRFHSDRQQAGCTCIDSGVFTRAQGSSAKC